MTRPLDALLGALAGDAGLIACGLVDAQTGMVCHFAGGGEHVALVEAASDYWRLALRHRPVAYAALGPARAQVLIHESARITLAACGDGLLLVSLSAEPDGVDWLRWQRGVGAVQAYVAQL